MEITAVLGIAGIGIVALIAMALVARPRRRMTLENRGRARFGSWYRSGSARWSSGFADPVYFTGDAGSAADCGAGDGGGGAGCD